MFSVYTSLLKVLFQNSVAYFIWRANEVNLMQIGNAHVEGRSVVSAGNLTFCFELLLIVR